MESTKKLFGFLLLLWITSDAAVDAFPDSFSKNEVTSSRNLVGISSQIIANALMQGQSESVTNYVSSPLGYATILSILLHGSAGSTKEEIFRVLEFPENLQDVRNTFSSVLTDYAGNDSMIAPQFKTWFYIYKNNSVDEAFRKLLTNDYLVDVKDIERINFDFDTTRSDQFYSDEKQTNSKDISQFDELKQSQTDDFGNLDGFDALKIEDGEDTSSVSIAIADYDQLKKDEKSQVSKFDGHVDDKQYVEKSKITEELMQQEEEQQGEMKDDDESESGPEKISLSIKKLEDSMEIMEAQENRNFVRRFGRAQPLRLNGDITSALSGNSIMGRKNDDELKATESKMLLFNGLYFRGDWANKFRKSDETKPFNSPKKMQDVTFMSSNGLFRYAEIPSQNLIAVEIPYKNDRFSLLIVMPASQNDLKAFCKQSNYNNLNEISSQLEFSNLKLSVPTFRFECTSRAEKALGKLGLTTIFTSKADLSGISLESKGYQIEELVQHVAIRIDEAFSSESALSAGNVQGRQNSKYHEVTIDKPFVFYVRDSINDVILTSGKIMEVPVNEEIPIHFNI